MKIVCIDNWFGRLGNNILQIIRAIHYGIHKECNEIIFPSNIFLTDTKIKISNKKNINEVIKDKNNFFYIDLYNLPRLEPIDMKNIYIKYIKPIQQKNLEQKTSHPDDLYIHIRSGDNFPINKKVHPAYVQPPLDYYKKIIESYKWNSVIIVFEDKLNPVIQKLIDIYPSINTQSSSDFLQDVSVLNMADNLVVGFGTFGFLLYFMNEHIKNFYIPRFFIDELPSGKWVYNDELNLHIIETPNYIEVGKWENSKEQQELMINYKLE